MNLSELVPLRSGTVESSPNVRSTKQKWQSYFAQVIASSANNLLLFNLGLALSFPTMAIPALEFKKNSSTPIGSPDVSPEKFYLTEEEITWFSSVAYICQPIGSIFSGWLTERYGRKRTMFLVNFPFMLSWIMLYAASDLVQLILAIVIMGLAVGYMESAIITYTGEITEPSIRGILASVGGLAATFGIFASYFLSYMVHWRIAAIICLSVPIITAITICFLPETPVWLLCHGRDEDAIRALQWLRGWTTYEAIAKEYEMLKDHHKKKKDVPHSKINLWSSILNRLKELLSPATMKPFLVVNLCAFFGLLGGVSPVHQYYVQIFETYDVPMDAKTATVLIGVVQIASCVILILILRKVGKRLICLFSFFAMALLGIVLGIYALNVLPSRQTSFDRSNMVHEGRGLFPLIILFVLSFAFNIGANPIPWILLSEIFPYKSRGLATGVSAALNYIFAFVATKTYRNIEGSLGIAGATWFYSLFAVAGFVTMYLILPETEGITLEDIERHFAVKGQRLTSRKIRQYETISTDDQLN